MDRDVLMHQMTERFQELYSQALDALERAPDGQWITASEFAFRDAFLELMKESYQVALQSRIDAHPTAQQAAFSPSRQRADRLTDLAQQGTTSGSAPDGRRPD
jgi:hypothetical protein